MAESRPILISLLAILYFIVGIIVVIGGILLVTGTNLVEDGALGSLGTLGGGAMIIVGIIGLIVAGGLWNGWKIMWYLGVILMIVGIASQIYLIIKGDYTSIVGIIIEVLILFYLTRPKVRAFFGI